MSTDGLRNYEGMLLIDPTAGGDWQRVETQVQTLMTRSDAELLACRRWDERRLAYPIRGRKRGIYALIYFRGAPDKIAGMERDASLADIILRAIILRRDEVSDAELRGEEPTASDILDRSRGPSFERDEPRDRPRPQMPEKSSDDSEGPDELVAVPDAAAVAVAVAVAVPDAAPDVEAGASVAETEAPDEVKPPHPTPKPVAPAVGPDAPASEEASPDVSGEPTSETQV